MDLLNFSMQAWQRDPEMRMEDAYKWLFHATRGGEHAVTDDSGPRQWMDREWRTLGAPLPQESLVVLLRPDKKILRVNLRPYRMLNGDKEKLLAAFVRSAHHFKGEAKEFTAAWQDLGRVLTKGERQGLTLSEWKRVDKEMRASGYPAIHHSAHYETLRKPAYRVLSDTELETLTHTLARR